MTLEQFKYVLEVATTGSINQAANNLFLSQAALSTAIKNLEDELGQSIFLRNNRGAQLTSFGRDFVSYITPICSQVAQLEHICQQREDENRITFSVASNGYRFVAPICAKLYQRYRAVGIHIYHFDGVGDETVDYVANHQSEIGILRIWNCYKQLYMRQLLIKKLQFISLASVRVCIMVGRGSPLFALDPNQKQIALSNLAEFPMAVYPNLHTGPYSDIFSKMKIPENKNRIIVGSRAVLYDTLEHTDAFYVSSDSQLGYRKFEKRTSLRSFILEGCNIGSEIGWIKHEDYILTPIAKEFIRELTWMFQE